MLPKPESKGAFLKADLLEPLLKKGRANAVIDGTPKIGKFGLDVPLTIGAGKTTEAFVLTLSEKGRDYRDCYTQLGDDPTTWDGHTLVLGLREGKNRKGQKTQYVNVLEVE